MSSKGCFLVTQIAFNLSFSKVIPAGIILLLVLTIRICLTGAESANKGLGHLSQPLSWFILFLCKFGDKFMWFYFKLRWKSPIVLTADRPSVIYFVWYRFGNLIVPSILCVYRLADRRLFIWCDKEGFYTERFSIMSGILVFLDLICFWIQRAAILI
jgi:hypothetical protein